MLYNYIRLSLLILSTIVFVGCDEEVRSPEGDKIRENLVLQLHWIPDTHQLGFWVALDRGFYESANLEVTIHPGGLDANPVRDVMSGSADIGQIGGVEQAVIAVSEGLPLKALAAIHRESPHALISLASNPVTNAGQLKGKTIAVAYGDTAEIMLKAFMATQDIDQNEVSLVPFRFDLSPLLTGRVDVITGFSTSQPVTVLENEMEPVILAYNLAGIESYGYTLVSSVQTINDKAPALKRFLKATRLGWEYAFSNPEESVALFKARFGDLVVVDRAYNELNLIRSLMLNEEGELDSWQLDENRIQQVIERLNTHITLETVPDVSSVYRNDLVD